jgi:hypothetical protein
MRVIRGSLQVSENNIAIEKLLTVIRQYLYVVRSLLVMECDLRT